jgi:hypothetical protein
MGFSGIKHPNQNDQHRYTQKKSIVHLSRRKIRHKIIQDASHEKAGAKSPAITHEREYPENNHPLEGQKDKQHAIHKQTIFYGD